MNLDTVISKAKQIEVLAQSVKTNIDVITQLIIPVDVTQDGMLEVKGIEFSVADVNAIVNAKITELTNINTANLLAIDVLCDDIKTEVA